MRVLFLLLGILSAPLHAEYIFNNNTERVSSSGTITGSTLPLDLSQGSILQATLNSGGAITISFAHMPAGQPGTWVLQLFQGASGGTVTWPGSADFGSPGTPTLSVGSGKMDLFNIFTPDGTHVYITYVLGF